jgi:hypothetical protein
MSRRRDEAWARLRMLAEIAQARDGVERELVVLRYHRDQIAASELRIDMALDAQSPAPDDPPDDE